MEVDRATPPEAPETALAEVSYDGEHGLGDEGPLAPMSVDAEDAQRSAAAQAEAKAAAAQRRRASPPTSPSHDAAARRKALQERYFPKPLAQAVAVSGPKSKARPKSRQNGGGYAAASDVFHFHCGRPSTTTLAFPESSSWTRSGESHVRASQARHHPHHPPRALATLVHQAATRLL